MARRILVIGATGAVGSRLVTQLAQRGQMVRAATRAPAAVMLCSNNEAEFVEFDFERPPTFAPALNDVDRVFLIARPGDDRADQVAAPLIDAMKRQGVRHVVNLSAMGVETRDDIALRKVERLLECSGMGFTHLRPNWFMQVFSAGPLLKEIRSTGVIHLPAADAQISYVDVHDIAAVAAVALIEPGHEGKAYTLTGGQALDHHEIAQAISDAAGKQVRYVPISEETARQALATAGLPPERVERLLGFYRLVRQGCCLPVSTAVQSILGRPPIRFAQFTHDNAACWM